MKEDLKTMADYFAKVLDIVLTAAAMGTAVGLFFGIPMATIAGGIMLMYKWIM